MDDAKVVKVFRILIKLALLIGVTRIQVVKTLVAGFVDTWDNEVHLPHLPIISPTIREKVSAAIERRLNKFIDDEPLEALGEDVPC